MKKSYPKPKKPRKPTKPRKPEKHFTGTRSTGSPYKSVYDSVNISDFETAAKELGVTPSDVTMIIEPDYCYSYWCSSGCRCESTIEVLWVTDVPVENPFYEEQMAKYKKKLSKYKTRMKGYEVKMAEYEEYMKAWEALP